MKGFKWLLLVLGCIVAIRIIVSVITLKQEQATLPLTPEDYNKIATIEESTEKDAEVVFQSEEVVFQSEEVGYEIGVEQEQETQIEQETLQELEAPPIQIDKSQYLIIEPGAKAAGTVEPYLDRIPVALIQHFVNNG